MLGDDAAANEAADALRFDLHYTTCLALCHFLLQIALQVLSMPSSGAQHALHYEVYN